MSLPEQIDLGDGFVLDRSRVTDAEESARAIHESLEHLARSMPWATPEQATAEAQRERFARIEDEWQRTEHFDFLVRRAGEPRVLGIVGLDWDRRERFGGGAIEIGYWIHVDWCNRGLATQAARALADVALSLPEVEVVVIVCDETNVASAAVPRKLGFTLDGIVDADRKAPADSGQDMVWLRRRTPEDAVEFETSPNRASPASATRCTVPSNGGRRRCTSCSRYLEAVGFDATPRALGIDREGREILSYIPGDSGARGWAYVVPDDGLRAVRASAASLPRRGDGPMPHRPTRPGRGRRVHRGPASSCATVTADPGTWFGATATRWRSSTSTTPGPHRPSTTSRTRARVQRALPRRRRVHPLDAVCRSPGSRSPHRGVRRGLWAHDH